MWVIDLTSQSVSYYGCAISSHEDVLSLEPKSRDRLGFLVTQNHDFGGRLAPPQPSLDHCAGLNIAILRHRQERHPRIASASTSGRGFFGKSFNHPSPKAWIGIDRNGQASLNQVHCMDRRHAGHIPAIKRAVIEVVGPSESKHR